MNKELKKLQEHYEQTSIPKELDQVVELAIEKGRKGRRRVKLSTRGLSGVAAAMALFTIGLNSSPTFAKAMDELPVIGPLAEVLTWTTYELSGDQYEANIEVPAVENLKNQQLEQVLNEKYQTEAKALYEQFVQEVGYAEEKGAAHLAIESGYKVVTDNEKLLSIGRYVVSIAASGAEEWQYDTIDKQREVLLSLPMLFKDERYIDVISDYILTEMKKQMATGDKVYWVEDEELPGESFTKIAANQDFYITNEGKLVISFDEYEVAPGYMGVVQFEIPTAILKDLLVSDAYVK